MSVTGMLLCFSTMLWTYRALCISDTGAVQLFSAVDGSWLPVSGCDRPCMAAMWDSQHPHTFATFDGASVSIFAFSAASLAGRGMCPLIMHPYGVN